jgi:hypothetical protein
MTSAWDKEPISALTAGLAATIISWTFAVGYAPESLEALGDYSPWLYGPVATAAWAAFSAVAYLLIHQGNCRKVPSIPNEYYRCPDRQVAAPPRSLSVCASRDEKDRLAAVTAGLALTMSTWVAALSFAPERWMEALSAAPPWLYCLASVGLWASFSTASCSVFRALGRRERLELS